jgi:hypothetical protein
MAGGDWTAESNVYSEIEITKPERPGRGNVRIADDGAMWWQCLLRMPGTEKDGLGLDEVTDIIVQPLTTSHAALCG